LHWRLEALLPDREKAAAKVRQQIVKQELLAALGPFLPPAIARVECRH
jgi:hypothetical protein